MSRSTDLATIAADELLGVADETGRCLFCRGVARLDILDVWPELREFEFETCCEAVHDVAGEESVTWSRKTWQRVFEVLAGVRVRQTFEHAGTVRIDYGLEVRPLDRKTAQAFVRKHHRHSSAPPAADRFRHGVWNGGELVAVSIVGNPTSRVLAQAEPGTLEVRRVCVDPGLPSALVWNACSMLYGAACREAGRRGFSSVVTYTLTQESAASVRAAGFEPDGATRGGTWDRPSRRRTNYAGPTGRKTRHRRDLRKGVAA